MEGRVRILVPLGGEEGGRYAVPRTYVEAVRQAGGAAYGFAGPVDGDEAAAALDGFDGLMLTGGVDLDPRYVGETPHPALGQVDPARDALEWAILGAALERDLPILGICRGCQVLAARVGGELYQDLPSQFPGALQHAQRAPRDHESHPVRLTADTLGWQVLEGRDEVWVNSFHHQAVRRLPDGWRPFAWAPDGVMEGFEREGGAFALGVQWHPEGLVNADPLQRRLFSAFVAAGRRHADRTTVAR
jgi:putative glutamine amidotransferase